MRIRFFLTGAFLFGLFTFAQADLLHAQKTTSALTILYSNNINGEIDPCPT